MCNSINNEYKSCNCFVVFDWNIEEFEALLRSCERDNATPYILKYIPKNGKILDAGCGLGRYVFYLAKQGYDITGIEYNRNTVEKVRKLAPDLDVRQGDISNLPFEDESISGVICLGVVEHFIDGVKRPLRELWRVLKLGGIMVITVPSFNYLRRFRYALKINNFNPIKILKELDVVRKIFRRKPLPSHWLHFVPYRHKDKADPEQFFEYRFTKEEFEAELKRANFTIIESVPIALMDGIFHEFGEAFVSFKNWTFYPNILGKLLNYVLGRIPFCHNHMHLVVVRK